MPGQLARGSRCRHYVSLNTTSPCLRFLLTVCICCACHDAWLMWHLTHDTVQAADCRRRSRRQRSHSRRRPPARVSSQQSRSPDLRRSTRLSGTGRR